MAPAPAQNLGRLNISSLAYILKELYKVGSESKLNSWPDSSVG